MVTVTTNGSELDFHKFDDDFPKILHDPAASVDPGIDDNFSCIDPIDGLTYPSDSFLIAIAQTTVTASEGNGDESQNINECGLFVSPSNDPDYPFIADDMQIFARVTFSTIVKDSSRELIFSWYIYF